MKYSLKNIYKEAFSGELHEAQNWNTKYKLDADKVPSRKELYYYMHWIDQGRKDQSYYDNSNSSSGEKEKNAKNVQKNVFELRSTYMYFRIRYI